MFSLLLRISLGSSPHENSMHMGTRLMSPVDVFLALFPVSPSNCFCMLEKKHFFPNVNKEKLSMESGNKAMSSFIIHCLMGFIKACYTSTQTWEYY